jgi:hypothetical protein
MTCDKIKKIEMFLLILVVVCTVVMVYNNNTMKNRQDDNDHLMIYQNVTYVKSGQSGPSTITYQQELHIQDTRPPKQIAYLLTTDANSSRTKHSQNVLTVAGFDVVLSLCEMVKDVRPAKVWSNKNTFIRIIKNYIDSNSTDWLYVFEDDIETQTSATIEDIKQNISASTLFTYLGICGPKTTPNGNKCGRCAHAMGFSYAGARDILLFNYGSKRKTIQGNIPIDEPFFDVVVEAWCFLKGGFSVVHFEQESPQDKGHNGLFFQNRQKFTSIIND